MSAKPVVSCIAALGVLATAVSIAYADDAPSESRVMESITVTAAEKRETDLQKTHHSVTTLSADDLERSGIEGNEDLQFQVPTLTFGVIYADTQITLRGIGNENITPGGDPGVAMHVDGVYLGPAERGPDRFPRPGSGGGAARTPGHALRAQHDGRLDQPDDPGTVGRLSWLFGPHGR